MGYSDTEPVSNEMNQKLDETVGKIRGNEKEIEQLLNEEERKAGYRKCTWYGGCYYCQDVYGQWHKIKCLA